MYAFARGKARDLINGNSLSLSLSLGEQSLLALEIGLNDGISTRERSRRGQSTLKIDFYLVTMCIISWLQLSSLLSPSLPRNKATPPSEKKKIDARCLLDTRCFEKRNVSSLLASISSSIRNVVSL